MKKDKKIEVTIDITRTILEFNIKVPKIGFKRTIEIYHHTDGVITTNVKEDQKITNHGS